MAIRIIHQPEYLIKMKMWANDSLDTLKYFPLSKTDQYGELCFFLKCGERDMSWAVLVYHADVTTVVGGDNSYQLLTVWFVCLALCWVLYMLLLPINFVNLSLTDEEVKTAIDATLRVIQEIARTDGTWPSQTDYGSDISELLYIKTKVGQEMEGARKGIRKGIKICCVHTSTPSRNVPIIYCTCILIKA